MKILLKTTLPILLAASLAACSMSNKDVGAITGGGAGALAGGLITKSPVGAAVGAVAGGVGGYYIGKSTEKKK